MSGYWNYRVVRSRVPNLDAHQKKDAEDLFEIKEVYYEENGTIYSYSIDGMNPSGETKRELRKDLEKMLEALDKPTLRQELLDMAIENRAKEKV